jgi:hypothetical protein
VTERARYRREVERLLAQIAERTRELNLLKAHGARGAALREPKRELKKVRMELAAVVTAAGSY